MWVVDRDGAWTSDDPTWHDVALSVGSRTHAGGVRSINEDDFVALPPVFAVADGMGGHREGEAASAIVAEEFAALGAGDDLDHRAVEACIERCRERIVALGSRDVSDNPGSTVVAGVLVTSEDGRCYWMFVNVGDSRAYLAAEGVVTLLSKDHTVVQELVDAGELSPEQARHHGERHVITRALGAIEQSAADYTLVPITGRCRLLLCSDGVSGELSEAAVADELLGEHTSQEIADRLVAAVLEAGGHDNATAVVVDVTVAARQVVADSDTRPGTLVVR